MKNTVRRLGAGLDTRAEGGYVVAPGSIHPSGATYRWVDGGAPGEVELAEAPDWLLDLVRPRPVPVFDGPPPTPIAPADRYVARALDGEIRRVLDATEGTRNDTLFRAAASLGELVGAGVLDEAVAVHALAIAGARVGLEPHEIGNAVANGIARGRLQPRGVWKDS